MKIFCRYSAVSLLWAPTTQVVGIHFPTSSAWLGPESTATSACGISSSMIWDNVINVFSSTPFATSTIFCPSLQKARILCAVLLVNGEGTAKTRISLSVMASSRSPVTSIFGAKITPGSFFSCCLFVRSISTSSGIIDQIVTSWPLLFSSTASAVPHVPAPIIPIFAIRKPPLFLFCFSFYFFLFFDERYVLRSVPDNSLLIFSRCFQNASTARKIATAYSSYRCGCVIWKKPFCPSTITSITIPT